MEDLTRPPPALVTIKEAMALRHVSRKTVNVWMTAHRVDVVRIDHHHPRIVTASLPPEHSVDTFFSVSMGCLHRLERLSSLLRALECGMAASARLEAYEELSPTVAKHHLEALAQFEERLVRLEARIVLEMDRLTVERGRVDLLLKQQRDLELAALAVAG